MKRVLRRAPYHKTNQELRRIEELLKENEARELPYIPANCTNECVFRQMGFCMERQTIAPKYDDLCIVRSERSH